MYRDTISLKITPAGVVEGFLTTKFLQSQNISNNCHPSHESHVQNSAYQQSVGYQLS